MTSNYEPLNVIGKGSFGMIRKVRRVSDGKILARKEIDYRRMSEKEKRQLVSEVNILRELKHPNIVRYYERVVDKEQCRIYIVMEYCSGGDLGSLIEKCRKEGKIIPEPTIWSFLAQLSLALLECHHTHSSKSPTGSSILHRDIKPDNVLLDDKNNIKLGDFGLSTVVSNPIEEMRKTWVGTPFYMSPELINESTYNTKSDIWALGCLIYELCALHPPFQADSHPGLAMKIRQGRVPPLPNHYSADLGRVVRTMLCGDPDKRPTAADLCKHEKVKVIIKEREAQMFYESLKHHESTLAKRENSLKLREQSINQREESINQKEEEFKQREEELKRREEEMVRREKEFENRMLSAGEFITSRKELVRSLSDEVRELELGRQKVEEELDGDVEMREEREPEIYEKAVTLNQTKARDFGDFASSEPIQMNLKSENGLYRTRFSENFAYLRSRSEHLPSSSSKANIFDKQPLSQPNYPTSHTTPSSLHPAPSPSQKFKSLSKFYQHRTKSANNCSDEESASSTPISKSRPGSNSTSNSNSPTSSVSGLLGGSKPRIQSRKSFYVGASPSVLPSTINDTPIVTVKKSYNRFKSMDNLGDISGKLAEIGVSKGLVRRVSRRNSDAGVESDREKEKPREKESAGAYKDALRVGEIGGNGVIGKGIQTGVGNGVGRKR